MIERIFGVYVGVCGTCGDLTIDCETYQECIDEMKKQGWSSVKVENDWENICTNCGGKK